MSGAGAVEVRHGYTMDHLHALAKVAVNRAFSRASDYGDRFDAAWHGICEHLCAAEAKPQPWDLIAAGRAALDRMVSDDLRHRGTRGRDAYEGPASAPNFRRFWWDQAIPSPSCENRVVDRVALRQIWPLLPDRQREALTALAVHEDYEAAAASMGVTAGTFRVHISHARRRFLAYWHEGEQPSGVWGTDRRRGNGRAGGSAAQGKRRPATRAVARRSGRPQREIVHGRASTYANHACRCEPCTRAATLKAADYRRAAGMPQRNLVTDAQRAEAARLREAGMAWRAVGAALGISEASAIRAVNGRAPAKAGRS